MHARFCFSKLKKLVRNTGSSKKGSNGSYINEKSMLSSIYITLQSQNNKTISETGEHTEQCFTSLPYGKHVHQLRNMPHIHLLKRLKTDLFPHSNPIPTTIQYDVSIGAWLCLNLLNGRRGCKELTECYL